LLETYPSGYTDAERAQTFLWYYLRRFEKKAVHFKTIQRYFCKADRRVSSIEELRGAFKIDPVYEKMFPSGSSPDTFGFAHEYRDWHHQRFGKCVENTAVVEKSEVSILETKLEHPFWFGRLL